MVGKKSGRALLRDEGMSVAVRVHVVLWPGKRVYTAVFPEESASANARNGSLHITDIREGLMRTDNGMEPTGGWPQAVQINQKNYYT